MSAKNPYHFSQIIVMMTSNTNNVTFGIKIFKNNFNYQEFIKILTSINKMILESCLMI